LMSFLVPVRPGCPGKTTVWVKMYDHFWYWLTRVVVEKAHKTVVGCFICSFFVNGANEMQT